MVILGLPPGVGGEESNADDELLGQLMSVDGGLVGFFLVSGEDHEARSLNSIRAEAFKEGWSLAVMDPKGTYTTASLPGLLLCPAGADPHLIDLGRIPPSVNPLEVALEVMRPDLVVAGSCGTSWPTFEHPNMVSVRDAIGLASLHLRRRGVFLLHAVRGSTLRTDKGSWYRVGAKALVPALSTCHAAWKFAWLANIEGGSAQESDRVLRIGRLLSTVEQRLVRTLQARDRLRWGTDYVSGNEDDIHLDLDSFLLALQGAVDAGIRAIDLAGGPTSASKYSRPNWRSRAWVAALDRRWPVLASLYSDDQNARAAVGLLADFRNRIHSDTWGYVRNGRAEQALHEMEIWIRCDDPKVPEFRSAMKQLGGQGRWHWSDIGSSSMFLDPVILVEELLSRISCFLNVTLMQMAADWHDDVASQHPSAMPSEATQNPAADDWKQRETSTVLAQLGVRPPSEA